MAFCTLKLTKCGSYINKFQYSNICKYYTALYKTPSLKPTFKELLYMDSSAIASRNTTGSTARNEQYRRSSYFSLATMASLNHPKHKEYSFLSNFKDSTNSSSRQLWGWLNSVFNRYDSDRVEEVGPNRACAEWLLRCGATVRWSTHKHFVKEYNHLPIGGPKLTIEEVNATDSAVMGLGFEYFRGCKDIKRVVLHKATYIDDESLNELQYLRNSLEELQVSACGNVTDDGLKKLAKLSNLQHLLLYDFLAVKDKADVEKFLQEKLPDCNIVFTYATEEQHRQMIEEQKLIDEENNGGKSKN